MLSRRTCIAALILAALPLAACGGGGSSARSSEAPSATATPQTSALTPSPTPTAEPAPAPPAPGQGIVVGGAAKVYAAPSSASDVVATLPDLSPVTIAGQTSGQDWMVQGQTWFIAYQDWRTAWYQLEGGGYIYSAHVFVPRPGEASPLEARGSAGRSVVVDLDTQTAYAMIGTNIVHRMPITSGKAGFETPRGQHRVSSWGRVANERMTSSLAGIDDPADQYDVQRVLFTQYFASGGYALHVNYWQPYSAFGAYPTSHGCVGLLLHDAQYLWLFAEAGTPVTVRGTREPVKTPTPSPTATPAKPRSVEFVAIAGAPPGGTASVAVQTAPAATCSISFAGPDGTPSAAQGLGTKPADASGRATWSWGIDTATARGAGSVSVTCDGVANTAPLTVG